MWVRGTEVAVRISTGLFFIYSTNTEWNFMIHSDCRSVNTQIVRNTLPIPKISTVLQELKGFTTALDINMGYYNIRLDPDSSKIWIIIFLWGSTPAYDYQWALHILPWSSKPTELMVALKFVWAYINNLLCITKNCPDDHLMKQRVVQDWRQIKRNSPSVLQKLNILIVY